MHTPPGSVRLAVIAPLQQPSPFGVSWGEVLTHTAQLLAWKEPSLTLEVRDAAEAGGGHNRATLRSALASCRAAVVLGVEDPETAALLAPLLSAARTAVPLGCAVPLAGATRLAGRHVGDAADGPTLNPLAPLLQRLFPDKQTELDGQVLKIVEDLYRRNSSDDFVFIFLVLTNAYINQVPAVSMTFKQKNAGLDSLACMVGKCGGQIFRCVTDPTCKAALDCLQGCEFNDQVCTYRCITSYESPLLEDFSLCIIQKHNCFGLTADIPMVPDPAPLTTWRGEPLTHELAEDLFIGWLKEDPSSSLHEEISGAGELFSWRVFAGKNAAYDFFPCQFQLFYRGKGKGGMWYDPTFQVETLNGRRVWRRRHYRVKRGQVPGTFRFSVLDNGVTSNEYWRILDCAEDLGWCVFYYSGAASRAGLSYSGAILASKDGQWPASEEARTRIEKLLAGAGIKPWELSNVDNSACAGAPLDPSLMALA
ncbi:violaxanthin de-epoxidase-related [Micractinium conductrix]|uniref:Violaxanthin de-epoxidase-related n=1 Tax=Micractinium conductrix TaxID=554055 RepID=A0A2P6V3H5_9CHLO|nr:violaxanthin de-epoxidase-related [Micractinium conductrix]|eukprot:PSC68636.1 violaxanthin de-epoxidase-related [Micractinium conductrix]